MEWIDRMNLALAYIEENLSGEIRYERAAEIACCSTFHFQRMFAYIAGVPLSEYIRRRRMTRAAQELQEGAKVIDVGLRYGYNSPTAFNRAFQAIHKMPPSEARKPGAVLRAFPPISFKITVNGVAEMEYRIEQKPAIRIVGIGEALSQEIEQNFSTVPALWARAAQEGLIGRLAGMMNAEPMGILGVSACYGEHWRYLIAAATDAPVPEDMESYEIPASTWAIFSGSGRMPDDIQALEKRAVTEWLPTSGYEYADAPDIEVYQNADPANAQFEVWLPIRKKPN